MNIDDKFKDDKALFDAESTAQTEAPINKTEDTNTEAMSNGELSSSANDHVNPETSDVKTEQVIADEPIAASEKTTDEVQNNAEFASEQSSENIDINTSSEVSNNVEVESIAAETPTETNFANVESIDGNDASVDNVVEQANVLTIQNTAIDNFAQNQMNIETLSENKESSIDESQDAKSHPSKKELRMQKKIEGLSNTDAVKVKTAHIHKKKF